MVNDTVFAFTGCFRMLTMLNLKKLYTIDKKRVRFLKIISLLYIQL